MLFGIFGKKLFFIIAILVLLLGPGATILFQGVGDQGSDARESASIRQEGDVERAFLSDGLETNTAKASIDLQNVLDGGPGKDGIPAINEPKFVTTEAARDFLSAEDEGMVIYSDGEAKFYPFSILVWHEIVNDTIGETPVAVTFCPLCGSSIAFDATKKSGGRYVFGVSGKLYESNLLMYDQETESLWSQILGEAVVGERMGVMLDVYPSDRLLFGEASSQYADLRVLSQDTGFRRNYEASPYGGYNDNENLYFPVAVNDERFPAKTLFYITNSGEYSIAFHYDDLRSEGKARVELPSGEMLIATFEDGITRIVSEDNEEMPGYFAMWFSWATHHQEDSVVWSSE